MRKTAIIGISGLFPGSTTREEFWNNLIQGKDLTSLANESDFGADPESFFHPEKGVPDKCYSLRGGYIRNFKFDPEGYNLPADFLAKQDKLYQWSLHVAKEALMDSGYLKNKKNMGKSGLVLGNLSFPTGSSHKLLSSIYTQTTEAALRQLIEDENLKITPHHHAHPQNEVLSYTPSQMVSEALGLGSGHYSLDAACATSLYAIKLACDELHTGKSDLMLAGAVCAPDMLFVHMGFSVFHADAPAGQKYAPLDKNSTGLVSAEGAGMVVLKRFEDAERDNDKILAVIVGTGLSNDGRGKFLLSPNPKGQRLAFERAYEEKGIKPEKTSYIECHATGTPLGDTTELNSIADFFYNSEAAPLLGSVKSNIGHLLTAAGMTGLLKVLLAMQKGVIPPNINLDDPLTADNGWIGKEQMIIHPTKWNHSLKQAGINSFGFGGTNAHMVLQNYKKSKSKRAVPKVVELAPMAIIGMDAHFGDCSNLDDFYSTIYHGKQHFKPLPKGRWKGFENNTSLLKAYGLDNGKAPQGAYISDFEIDLLRYKTSPKEAETFEPQQALILKVADKAIIDAGLDESQNVAVLIAMATELACHQYLARWDVSWQLKEALLKNNITLNKTQEIELEELCKNSMYYREGTQTPSQHISIVGNIMASRIAALWDFSGPAFTVSAGEDSVFKALEIAQNMLSMGEVDAVVLGGVDFSGGIENVLLRNKKNKVNSSQKPSISLNKNDKGWLVGEGAGAIVLKKKLDAGKDKIYAIIDDIGKADAVPNGGYIELASTGIESQDKTETQFLLNNKPHRPVALGSVKANIGNTYAASGIAALIKTALCLKHRFIPGISNWSGPEDSSVFSKSNYYFPSTSRPWILQKDQDKRIAAVSGVNNVQIRLSESEQLPDDENTFLHKNTPQLFLLKGNTVKELKQQLSTLEIALESATPIVEIAHQFYRKYKINQSDLCVALIADNKGRLQKEIQFFLGSIESAMHKQQTLKTPRGSYFTPRPLGKNGKVAFVYPGSFTSYEGLGKDLFQLFPQLYNYFEKILPNLEDYIWPDYLFPKQIKKTDTPPNLYENAITMMSAGSFYSAGFTHILRTFFKLQPDIAFGYSLGECDSMWYSLGVWRVDEVKVFQESPIIRKRLAGNLELLAEHWDVSSEEAKENWISMVLLAPKEKVLQLVDNKENVYLTFINTADEVVISGDKTECTKVAEALNCHSFPLPVQNVLHHDFCKIEREGLIKMHEFPLQDNPDIDFYSSLSQSKLPLNSSTIAENSADVCCRTVDFTGTVNTVFDAGAKIFIELGANATCTNWIKSILKEKEHHAISINKKGKTDIQSLVELLTQLISHGIEPDLSLLFPVQKNLTRGRRFLKKMMPGGARIFDSILTEENRKRFAGVKKVKIKKESKEPVLAETEGAFSGSALSIETELPENGLRLQKYETGEQLEGKDIIFSQEDLEEFATGKIANVFGPEYSIIDTYRRRVMLPMHPYLLVSRVTGLNAKMGEFKPSTIQTEYDIPYNAWYTTDRQIPLAVSVESGQCDLMLISYLGIDFQNKGNLIYRLLDCTLNFVDDLPFEGQTLRYDISINSFVRNGDNLLFFFSYKCFVQDRLVLKMNDACAGFFTDDELEKGNGVVYKASEIETRLKAKKKHFIPLLKTHKTVFSKEDIQHLTNGDIEKCFEDESYFANGRNPSLCLPPEKILLIDRIVSVDLRGGAYGLGYIVAEKDLHPDDWYFPCHFRDDEVMAGSLQAEAGSNLLRFFILQLGLQRLTKDARFQPVFDMPQKVRCRKEVTPKNTKLVYNLEIKEIGLIPNPYVIADLEIISEGIVTVYFENLGLQLREKTNPRYLEKEAGNKLSPRSAGALFNENDITTFALGDLSKCFGPEFAVYDGRKVSRQPNTDLQLISRVLKIDGVRGDFSRPSTIHTEYDVECGNFSRSSTINTEFDVAIDAWYYKQNSAITMPYSILMEIALQPCGLLGLYLGSTLQFPDKDLYIRNLDADVELLELPYGTDFRGKIISNKAVLVSSVALGGTVLQDYTFELSVDGQVFYKGKTSFGFFSADALASQVGLDNGSEVGPWYKNAKLTPQDYMRIKLDSLYGKMKLFQAPPSKPHYRLAENQLNLLDNLIIAKNQGEYGKGYIHATKFIRSYDWYFTCHFYLDPVMPGSLGIEAVLQAMQVFALQQDLGKNFSSAKFIQVPNHKTIWKYRGQILQDVKEMHLEVHIKTIEHQSDQIAIIADAYLWNNKMRIYQITDLALGIEESDSG